MRMMYSSMNEAGILEKRISQYSYQEFNLRPSEKKKWKTNINDKKRTKNKQQSTVCIYAVICPAVANAEMFLP